MMDKREIREAILRLSCIERMQFHYDLAGEVSGDGPIHYLLEVGDLFFMAWENNITGNMIVNPITRFRLDELGELGAEEAWTVLRVPADLMEGIQFREIDDVELSKAYFRMESRAAEASVSIFM